MIGARSGRNGRSRLVVTASTKIRRVSAAFCRMLERGRLVRLFASAAGFTILEAIVSALVVGIAGMGVLMLFGTGQTYIQSSGTDRIAAQLAQQRIEQVRAAGFGKKFPNDNRQELVMTAVPGNPGFERTTVFTDVCSTNFAIAWNNGACVPATTESQTRLVTVTVRALNGSGAGTDPQTTPAVMQTVLVRR
jgi:type II secretory pathway pseudopilin PulG